MVFLLLWGLAGAWAHEGHAHEAGAAGAGAFEVALNYRGVSEASEVVLEVLADPPPGEVFAALVRFDGAGRELVARRVLRAEGGGRFRFTHRFAEGGVYAVYLRHGAGIEYVSGTSTRFLLGAAPQEVVALGTLRRAQGADVPRWAQPLGYAVFALLAGLALAWVGFVLRRYARAASARSG